MLVININSRPKYPAKAFRSVTRLNRCLLLLFFKKKIDKSQLGVCA